MVTELRSVKGQRASPPHCSIKETRKGTLPASSSQPGGARGKRSPDLRSRKHQLQRQGRHGSHFQTSVSLHSDLPDGSKRGEPVPGGERLPGWPITPSCGECPALRVGRLPLLSDMFWLALSSAFTVPPLSSGFPWVFLPASSSFPLVPGHTLVWWERSKPSRLLRTRETLTRSLYSLCRGAGRVPCFWSPFPLLELLRTDWFFWPAAGSCGLRPFPTLQRQPEAGAAGGAAVPPRYAWVGAAWLASVRGQRGGGDCWGPWGAQFPWLRVSPRSRTGARWGDAPGARERGAAEAGSQGASGEGLPGCRRSGCNPGPPNPAALPHRPPGCLDMLSLQGQFTFTADRPQLHCAAFFIAEPEEFITIHYELVSIDCESGDFLKVRRPRQAQPQPLGKGGVMAGTLRPSVESRRRS